MNHLKSINSTSTNLLEVTHLTKKYGNKIVINDISFNVKDGEIVGIVGKNGAGKTTLVEMLIGVKKQTSGIIRRSYGDSKKEISKLSGIQFQNNIYPDNIKVKDLIYFYRDVYSNNQFIKNRLNELIESFHLKEHMNAFAKRLSGGQQQRLNILLAVIHNPKLLVLDEFSTGLDVHQKQKIKNFIKTLIKQNNWTVIMISHNMEELEQLCERILVIENGKLVYDMAVSEIDQKYGTIYKFIDQYFTELNNKEELELKNSKGNLPIKETLKEFSFIKKIIRKKNK